ncbi:cyclin-dependent kinase inhibitor 1D isoform X2 [Clupea harengus]|nr:cyclin-dependent kinase inhibitor 1D isoform X2 [Clupea harengus]
MALLSSEQEPAVPLEEARGRCGVRRNLFGPVDHQQLEQDFQRLLRTSVATATRRWDFDFLSDRPAPGSALEWEELRCQDVPEFYHSSVVNAAGTSCSSSSSFSSSSSPTCSSSAGSPQRSSRGVKRGISSLSNIAMETKHKQATITDFFTVRKRRRLHIKVMTRQ